MFKITTTEALMAAVEEAKRAREHEEWLAALLVLDGINSPIPNAKPLAQLLRSGKPVPPGICGLLAEMLYDFRLSDSRQRDSFPESKQLRFVAMNREGANYDDDSRAFERRSVA